MSTARRPGAQILLTVLFALLGLQAFVQAVLHLVGRDDDPAELMVLQAIIGVSGVMAARGAWTAARWSPLAALGYGALTAWMLFRLGPMLELEPEEARGIRIGALSVVLFALSAAWYLRRLVRANDANRATTRAPT